MVWESLHNVDGDSCFCDSDFHLSHSLGKSHGAEGGGSSPEKQLQVDQVCGALGAVHDPLAAELHAFYWLKAVPHSLFTLPLSGCISCHHR